MKRPLSLLAALLGLALVAGLLSACGDDATLDDAVDSATDTAEDAMADAEMAEDETDSPADGEAAEAEASDGEAAGSEFPRVVETANGPLTIPARPERIVSLSPTATEVLYAVGAGDQVAAVDNFSNYPPEAPDGSLDAFVIDLEAVLAVEPDLVVLSGAEEAVLAGLAAVEVPVLVQPAAVDLDGVYDQIAQIGEATGNIDGAATVNAELRDSVAKVLEGLPEAEEPVRVFHEIDDSFYTATSSTFIGQVYAEMGFENIADAHDADGFGYPLIDGETIIDADPTLIVFTSQVPYSADDIAARPGWDSITAVQEGAIVQVDADVASRWGPRIDEFMEAVAEIAAAPVG